MTGEYLGWLSLSAWQFCPSSPGPLPTPLCKELGLYRIAYCTQKQYHFHAIARHSRTNVETTHVLCNKAKSRVQQSTLHGSGPPFRRAVIPKGQERRHAFSHDDVWNRHLSEWRPFGMTAPRNDGPSEWRADTAGTRT